jgi:hypothetical protein
MRISPAHSSFYWFRPCRANPTSTRLISASDIANEVTGTGYTAGGVAATVTVGSVDTTNDRTPVTITDLTNAWTSSTISAVGGWLYKVVGSAATDQLVGFVDFGGTVTSTAGNYSVTFTAPLYVNG